MISNTANMQISPDFPRPRKRSFWQYSEFFNKQRQEGSKNVKLHDCLVDKKVGSIVLHAIDVQS